MGIVEGENDEEEGNRFLKKRRERQSASEIYKWRERRHACEEEREKLDT